MRPFRRRYIASTLTCVGARALSFGPPSYVRTYSNTTQNSGPTRRRAQNAGSRSACRSADCPAPTSPSMTDRSGAAGALNMWYESDLDSLMTRTCLRPIPTGKLTKNQALTFGILSSIVSVIGLYIFSNLISASILAFTILFYVFVYTIWLKRKTPQNIVIGGAAGALPPMIGWAIVMNGISLESFILFLIIFIWTPSHFWALSLYKSEDYKKASIPMLPITSGIKTTKLNIFIYSLILFPTVLLPYFLNYSGLVYLILSTIMSIYYLFISYKLLVEKNSNIEKKLAAKLFGYSILYLFMIFVFILVDKAL